jgi:hypothetical protein
MNRDLAQYLLSAGLLCVGLDAAAQADAADASAPAAVSPAADANGVVQPSSPWQKFSMEPGKGTPDASGGGGGGKTGC